VVGKLLLLALDRADAAFRRNKKTSKKMKGGADIDGHETIENMEQMMEGLEHNGLKSTAEEMTGGGKKDKSKSKSKSKTKTKTKTKSKPKTKKPLAKKESKGGNFLETVTDFVAPSGWETFATTAGLLALDRADAVFRRNKKTNQKQKGGLDHKQTIQSEEQIKGEEQMKGGREKSTKKSETKKSKSKKINI
jgi:hypothetical protein